MRGIWYACQIKQGMQFFSLSLDLKIQLFFFFLTKFKDFLRYASSYENFHLLITSYFFSITKPRCFVVEA